MAAFVKDWMVMSGPSSAKSGMQGNPSADDGKTLVYDEMIDELTDGEVSNLLALNVESTTWMTRLALPGMLSRRRGAIVNLSSRVLLLLLWDPALQHRQHKQGLQQQ